MKTTLPKAINTIEEAKLFLTDLHKNNEVYHPEDDAKTIEWQTTEVSEMEAEQLNKLMSDIYSLAGNDGKHSQGMVFDPCEYLIVLDNKIYLARTVNENLRKDIQTGIIDPAREYGFDIDTNVHTNDIELSIFWNGEIVGEYLYNQYHEADFDTLNMECMGFNLKQS